MGEVMNIINLEDAKVNYEGQSLSAVSLIGKLQEDLRDAAARIAAIGETLGNLQTALLNCHTVEVKLTLSKEEYEKFKSLGGMDDNDRIRQAVLNVIHPGAARVPFSSGDAGSAAPTAESRPAISLVESQSVTEKPPTPSAAPAPEPRPGEQAFQERPIPPEPPEKKKLITKCPTCQALIDLPETSNDQWPIELKCGNCGAKCLVKPSFRRPA
jgi:hypothetical protein